MINLSELNERQLQAVMWQDGPLLVLAGPGSGKTTVLTSRIARILEETADAHFRVLGLTFTNAAATEMRRRIEGLVPGASTRVLMTTFHSFSGDLLRQHGHLVGLRPDFVILSQDAERVSVLDAAITSLSGEFESGEFDIEQYGGDRILPVVSRITENDVSLDAREAIFASLPSGNRMLIEAIYAQYRKKLIESNSLDFSSMISEAIRLLKEYPSVRKQTLRIYKHICVDEFQDTNLAQYTLLKCLVDSEKSNLFVVADDDQVIYQWNGASPTRILNLKMDFGVSTIQLPANYRCPPEVIALANRLIAHNTFRTPDKDKLLALKPNGQQQAVRVFHFREFAEEAAWVASDIASRSLDNRSQCVVLARARKSLELILQQLIRMSVPAYLAMRKDEFVSAPLRWLHAALKLVNNPRDRAQLKKVARAFFDLEGLQVDISVVTANAETFGGSTFRAFMDLALTRDEMRLKTRNYLTEAGSSFTERLDFRIFCEKSFSWLDSLQDENIENNTHFSEYNDEKHTWLALVQEIDEQFGSSATTLNVLIQELDMRSKTPPPPKGAIPCFTIHASKGMEFGHVYLVGMVEDQLPSWAAVKKGPESQEIQEERRNCFVAITRSRESLTMSYSQNMFGWRKPPSRFLREMGYDV